MKERAQRVRRTPINGARNVLTAGNKEPGFHYRFVNDTGDRVSDMQERGYEVVTDKTIQIGDRRVATPTAEGSPRVASVGGGTKAVLMRIKDEWFKEDQEAKQADIDEMEQSIKQTGLDGGYGKVDIGRKNSAIS